MHLLLQGTTPQAAPTTPTNTALAPAATFGRPGHRIGADLTDRLPSLRQRQEPPRSETPPKPRLRISRHRCQPIAPRLAHHVFTKGEWRKARLRDHPRVPLTISLARPGGHAPITHAEISAIADTGAQSDLWSLEHFLACGFSREELHPISLSLSAANRSPIRIEGAFFATLATTSPSGGTASCHSMVYVSSSVSDMYLSHESLLNLGLLSPTFPSVNGSAAQPRALPPQSAPRERSPRAAPRLPTHVTRHARALYVRSRLNDRLCYRFPVPRRTTSGWRPGCSSATLRPRSKRAPTEPSLACKAPQWRSTWTPQPPLRHATPLRTCPYIGSSGSTLTSSATKP